VNKTARETGSKAH